MTTITRILCFLGRHDWTAWRRKAKSAKGSAQYRTCKRCGRKDARPDPVVARMEYAIAKFTPDDLEKIIIDDAFNGRGKLEVMRDPEAK